MDNILLLRINICLYSAPRSMIPSIVGARSAERRDPCLRGSGEPTVPRIGRHSTAADLQRHEEATANCTGAIPFAPCPHWLHFERVAAGATLSRYKEPSPTTTARSSSAPTTWRPASAAVTQTPGSSATKWQSRTRAAPSASTGTRQRPDGVAPASDPFRRSDRDRRESTVERPPVPKRTPPVTRPAAEWHRHWHRIHRPGLDARRALVRQLRPGAEGRVLGAEAGRE